MADEQVETALGHWTPRFVANGIEPHDLRRAAARIDSWADWLGGWVETAEQHLAVAEEAEAAGNGRTAGDAFVRAAACFHFAKFVWVLDPDANRSATDRAVSALYAGHRHLDPTAERVEVPFEATFLAGNLRRPPGVDHPPLVILLPGLDSAKEEFFHWEQVFLDRGLATFSLDGPGQGESAARMPIRGDYETAVTAALDALDGRTDVALERTGLAGVSLGGYYAVRAAAVEHRVKAVVGVSGPFSFGGRLEKMPSVSRAAFAHYAGGLDDAGLRAKAAEFDLAPVIERLTQPALIVTGKLDRIVPWEETKRVADAAPNARFVLYEDGGHVCNNLPYLYRPLVADWLREELEP